MICPILSATTPLPPDTGVVLEDCLKENCAWWALDDSECAVLSLSLHLKAAWAAILVASGHEGPD